MRILFLMPALPLVANHSGAASRFLQNFLALHRLGHAVTLVRAGTDQAFRRAAAESDGAQVLAEIRLDLTLDSAQANDSRVARLWRGAANPVQHEYPMARRLGNELQKIIYQTKPDLIWVETTELAAPILTLNPTVPWVLSHHDLQYRIRQIRYGARTWQDRWLIEVSRRAEQKVINSAPNILTGSATDAERLRALGAQRISVIPMSYEATPALDGLRAVDMHIVHLGSLETTANRVGLEAYLRRAHPQLMASCRAELLIIGDASRVKEPLTRLLNEAGAILKGYVADLGAALRPYDVAILPYEHDSGYRTKLPLLFSYSQVVVTTRAAVAGTQISGLADVCIILDRLEDFPEAIARLANQPAERERLGRAARAFFERHFTYETVLGHYRTLLDSIPESAQPAGRLP
jgi:glycosyltransferase involved in cell wall biosynthesis